MFCPKCGTSNPDNAEFCMSCHHQLSQPVIDTSLAAGEILYAGFWERFAALIVDSVVLMAVFTPIAILAGVTGVGNSYALNLLTLVLSAFYFALMESGERGATFGKRWLKLRVVDTQGNRISKLRGFGRWFAHALSDITLLIGYLIQPLTGRKQALHDMVSGTLVVKTERESNKVAIIIAAVFGALVFAIAILGILAAIAIPAYQDYVVKAKVVQAVVVGTQANVAVEDFYNKNGRIPASLEETQAPIIVPTFISNIGINQNNGDVEVTFQSSGLPPQVAGKSIVFHPVRNDQGNIVWQCHSDDLGQHLLPANCR